MALNVLGLRFTLPEALRRHFSRAVAAAVFLVHVAAATSASCRGISQQNIEKSVDELTVQNFLMDVLGIVTGARMFWDFGSLCQRRCGVFCADCCGSGNLFLRDVAAPLLLAVVAAAIYDCEDIAASLVPALAASAVDITA